MLGVGGGIKGRNAALVKIRDRQRLAPAYQSMFFMISRYYLHFLRCDNALPAKRLVVALVRPSLSALLAAEATPLDVTRHDFPHGIFHSPPFSSLCRVS